ncbi:ADC synthase, partial [Thamnocephalis sphaerospora]
NLRVLIIDNYDSYTLNLLQLLPETGCSVVVVQNDQLSWDKLRDYVLPHIDCIILSPGPGTPARPEDIGVVAPLLEQVDLPVLGVCLGHQAIAHVCGAQIVHAPEPVHGQVHHVHLQHRTSTDHDALEDSGADLFRGIPSPFPVVRYHSLTVSDAGCESGVRPNMRTMMALAHESKPFCGVQFHPESICTDHGHLLVHNFLAITERWHRTVRRSEIALYARNNLFPRPPLPEGIQKLCTLHRGTCGPSVRPLSGVSKAILPPGLDIVPAAYTLLTHKLSVNVAPDVAFCKLFGNGDGSVWLDSARVGSCRFSFMGSCHSPGSFQVGYRLADRQITITRQNASDASDGGQPHVATSTLAATDTFWDWTSRFMRQFSLLQARAWAADNAAVSEQPPFDFLAGLVGYFGYEMKSESLPGYVAAHDQATVAPDAAFVFLDRLLAFDHHTGDIWLVCLVCDEQAKHASGATPAPTVGSTGDACDRWMHATVATLEDAATESASQIPTVSTAFIAAAAAGEVGALDVNVRDTCSTYLDKIAHAQHYIRDGESYELCLTTQMTAQYHHSATSTLDFYLQLRATNPAPYAAFLNFSPELCIASASPERFLRVTAAGHIQMRPIKGTRKRQRVCCCGQGCERDHRGLDPACARAVDQQLADELAADVKERGENLMIVDLIRNDLARICPPHSVRVPHLMAIETYETVHQMVTTVDGLLHDTVDATQALKGCFPPAGSMTGAPKLRSVQLLEHLEDHRPRGIYSGCLGYLSVNGAADFNVVIRTAAITHRQSNTPKDISIGAGGAITILSDPMEEWHEATTKAEAVLPRFV